MTAPWITVASFSTPLEAHLVRGRLEAEGIAARIADEHLINADWLMSQALGGVKIQVEPASREAALAVLDALGQAADYDWGEAAPEPEPALTCPACGGTSVEERKWAWRFAVVLLFTEHIPLPFSRGRLECGTCGHRFRAGQPPAKTITQ